ncbi:hypothetical protein BH20ACT2_BH20ACT2_02190 [soil metagenome]
MTEVGAAIAPRVRSRTRFLASTFVGAVLVAAVASSVTWAFISAPTEQELRETAVDLVEGRRFASASTSHVDSSGLGPRQVRGTFTEPLSLQVEPADEAQVQRIRYAGERAGWDATIVRGPDDDDVSVEARRDGLLAEVTDRQIDLIATVPLTVHLAVGVGAVAGGLAGAAVNRRRQRRAESARSRRWRLAVAAGFLPVFALLAVAIPLFVVPANATLDVGDYGSLVLGVVVLFAGLWVLVAAVISLVVGLAIGRRPTPER